jgi:hypothetical protein
MRGNGGISYIYGTSGGLLLYSRGCGGVGVEVVQGLE